MKDTNLDEVIIGCVKPSIYAFTTDLVPNYLKVGDTCRPVNFRLNEWRQKYPDLVKRFEAEASVDSDVFFRDYQVHEYLLEVEGKKRLDKSSLARGLYYSKEFFKDTSVEDVSEAISDIQKDYKEHSGRYKYFDSSKLAVIQAFKSEGIWNPYKEQKDTICRFMEAYRNGRKNLLMYAVMRFGKSFTTMCCAKEMDAKIVVVVSAKKDVEREWKANVEKPDNFNKDYIFLKSDNLVADPDIIEKTIKNGKRVVLFLTLQDLQGANIKEKHRSLFEQEIDLLVVDETHYGARAEKYGAILRNTEYIDESSYIYKDEEDFDDEEELGEVVKGIKSKVVLHLSGTPYRILMDNEFSEEDIIAFYQYSDIVNAQNEWDKTHPDEEEWDNPYFGFPQMLRFAFNLSPSAQKLVEALKESGQSATFAELFRPCSTKKDKNGEYKKFAHEDEVLELFRIIDGSETDANILSFLDNEKIKSGKMCRHIVCVLPFCASCDALEELIKTNQTQFKNLTEYEIINISGVDGKTVFSSSDLVVNKIERLDRDGKKTLTLTVNRMLTGTTVKQWDTMIFLKDTTSPQEYDQAIFRLQSKNCRELTNEDERVFKQNMKPQTILIDFDLMRVFSMQESQSKIYNAREGLGGNNPLIAKMEKELSISPIITMNSGAIQEVEPIDIIAKLSQYSSEKGVYDDVRSIPVDFNILTDELIREEIEKQNAIGSVDGFQTKAVEGGSNDLGLYDGKDKAGKSSGDVEGDQNDNSQAGQKSNTSEEEYDEKSIIKKWETYCSRILFFAFLTNDTVISLNDIVKVCEKVENKRILDNLELNLNVIKRLQDAMDRFKLSYLDSAIYKSNYRSTDEELSPIERVKNAVKRFDRFSESEVQTPETVVVDMISTVSDDEYIRLVNERQLFIDMAGTVGEFTIGLFQKFISLNIPLESFKDLIVAVPSSKIAYEFIRKIYRILNLNEECIVNEFVASELVEGVSSKDDLEKAVDKINASDALRQATKKDEIRIGLIIGNPPYDRKDGGSGRSSKPLYNSMVDLAKSINPKYICFVIPAKWYSGGKGLGDFRREMLTDSRIREIVDYENVRDVFPVELPGGICQFLWDKDYDGLCTVINNGEEDSKAERKLDEYAVFIRRNKDLKIIEKVLEKNSVFLSDRVSSRKPFGLPTNYSPKEKGIPCHFIQKIGRQFALAEDIKDNDNLLNKWKLLAPKSPIAGQTDFTKAVGFYTKRNTIVAKPGECCTESYIVLGAFDSQKEVESFRSYIFTKIARFMLLQAVVSQDVTKHCFVFVPDLETYDHTITDDELVKLWNISDDEWEYIDSRIKEVL